MTCLAEWVSGEAGQPCQRAGRGNTPVGVGSATQRILADRKFECLTYSAARIGLSRQDGSHAFAKVRRWIEPTLFVWSRTSLFGFISCSPVPISVRATSFQAWAHEGGKAKNIADSGWFWHVQANDGANATHAALQGAAICLDEDDKQHLEISLECNQST